jgi:hypothetical protein
LKDEQNQVCPIGKRFILLNSALLPGLNSKDMSDEDLMSLKGRQAD